MNAFSRTNVALVALLVCAAVNAADAPSRKIGYADLDLATAAGVRALYTRIQTAAWDICRELAPSQGLVNLDENRKCRSALVDMAVADANRKELTALHRGKRDQLTASR